LRKSLRAGENYADLCAVDEDFRAKRALKQIIATVAWLDQKFMARKTRRTQSEAFQTFSMKVQMTEKRTEFGYERSIADGPFERLNCKYIPGYLIPADLDRMARHMGYPDTANWAMQFLLASPGATVGSIDKVTGRIVTRQIRTLVPAREPAHNHCVHFSENGRCNIHPVAPFGCAFFDCKQSEERAQEISSRGLTEIDADWNKEGPYSKIWLMLDAAGKRARSPRENRADMEKGVQRLIRKGIKA